MGTKCSERPGLGIVPTWISHNIPSEFNGCRTKPLVLVFWQKINSN